MESIKRIYLACRAQIAELTPSAYLISPASFTAVLLFGYYVNGNNGRFDGVLGGRYMYLEPEALLSILIFVVWISSTIISGMILKDYWKEENKAVRYLSLPMSNTERFTSLMLINGIYASLAALIPVLLLVTAVYLFRPESLVMAPPTTVFPDIIAGPLLHIFLMGLWLFPSIALRKKVGYIIFALIAGGIFYMSRTRGIVSDRLDLEQSTALLDEPGVVGVYAIAARDDVNMVSYDIPTPDGVMTVVFLVVAILFFVAAYIALTRKTA